jgi:hypothetical protein
MPLSAEELEGLVGGQPLGHDDRMLDDVARVHAREHLRKRLGPLKAVFAGLERGGAAGGAVERFGEPRGRDDARVGQPVEDLLRRGAEGDENRDVPSGRRRRRVLHFPVEKNAEGDRRQRQEKPDPQEPARRAHRAGALRRMLQVILEQDGRRGPVDLLAIWPVFGAAAGIASSEVSVSSWKRTGRPVLTGEPRRRRTARAPRTGSRPPRATGGSRRRPGPASSSRQNRARARGWRRRRSCGAASSRSRGQQPRGVGGRQADPLLPEVHGHHDGSFPERVTRRPEPAL